MSSDGINGLPVSQLNDVPDVATDAPAEGWALTWVASTSKWTPQAITQAHVVGLTDRLSAIDTAIENIDVATIVRKNGSYADPSWITSLAGSKVSGNIPGNAASITGAITQGQVTGLSTALTSKAPLDSPTFTSVVGITDRIRAVGSSTLSGSGAAELANLSGFGWACQSLSYGFYGPDGTTPYLVIDGPASTATFSTNLTRCWSTALEAEVAVQGSNPTWPGNNVDFSKISLGAWVNSAGGFRDQVAFTTRLAASGANWSARLIGWIRDAAGVLRQRFEVGPTGVWIFRAPSSTTDARSQGRLEPAWADSTDATRRGRVSLYVSDASGVDREAIRAESDGTKPIVRIGDINVTSILSGAEGLAVATNANTTIGTYGGTNPAIVAVSTTNNIRAKVQAVGTANIVSMGAESNHPTWLTTNNQPCIVLGTDQSTKLVGDKHGFFNKNPVTKPTITGSRSDGSALASAITALATLGLANDSTTA